MGLFLARGVDRGTAHDLAEEVFVEAWLGLSGGAFRGDPSNGAALGAWLRGIARNLAAAHHRRVRRAPKGLDSAELARVIQPGLAGGRGGGALREAIDRLPRSLREVVLVRYLDEFSGAEAAAVLGLSEKAVERRAARARGLLKEWLEGAEVKG